MNKADIDKSLQQLSVIDSNPEVIEKAKIAVNLVLRDETVKMQSTLLAITRVKIDNMSKLAEFASRVCDNIVEENKDTEAEIKELDIVGKMKLFTDIVKNLSILTASTEIAKDLMSNLQNFERTLASQTMHRLDPDVRQAMQMLYMHMSKYKPNGKKQETEDIEWQDEQQ